ncbi:alpha-1,3-glucosyltransferase, glycosyltransferase family 57 protein [Pseudohyphozyma bogoriensis]|nr:alpha-1,3-glucosyltransferase, glycosyltransferase family 57 protein [Pseudohyphozyma bogoriensis]
MSASASSHRSRVRSSTSRRSAPPVPPLPAPPPSRFSLLSTSETSAVVLSTVFKVLLFQAYHSTDFEVHRNWLAITHSLPLSKWYYDTTSEWTLDYPPFFAYFERCLAGFAYIVDPKIVELTNLGYSEWSVVAFQRSTVIVSELVLVAAVLQWARRSQKPDYPTAFIIAVSIILHPGLIIVDHIHFQYNGMLLGILLWSVLAARADNMYACAALFATLLNFKHIFIYLAPPYIVFLFRRHCFTSNGAFQFDRLVELGLIVVSVCAVSFGPFILAGGFSQIPQIISRLFPFQRGLNHAYWAANVWALVSAVDRVLVRYLIKRGWPIAPEALTSASRGLIGETTFGVLPSVTPGITFSLTLGFCLIFLTKLWFDPSYRRFLDAVVLSAMTSFLWGWHVHEKAVLLFLVPLGLTAVEDDNHLRAYTVASCAGIYSLFPLLIKPADVGIIHSWIFPPPPHWFWEEASKTVANATMSAAAETCTQSVIDGVVEAGCSLVEAVMEDKVVQPVVEASMEFLPLMLTSLYCSVGIVWAWLRLSWGYLRT